MARAQLPRLCAWRGALAEGDDVDAQLRRCYFAGAVAPDGRASRTSSAAQQRGVARRRSAGRVRARRLTVSVIIYAGSEASAELHARHMARTYILP